MDFYKFMWVPNTKEIIWDMKKERQIPLNHRVYSALSQYIDLVQWSELYKENYKDWLEQDKGWIFDLKNPINSKMINAIKDYNKNNSQTNLFYWYDLDRELYPDFQWEYCPLSQKKLKLLDDSYHDNNKYLSPEEALVMPAT